MKQLRCMSCGFTVRKFQLNAEQLPVYHDRTIYESSSGELRYCGNCLIHAQIVLTETLGYATVLQLLNSGHNNRLKEFGTPFHRNRIMWALNWNESTAGNGNAE